jgi:hypothetical protein
LTEEDSGFERIDELVDRLLRDKDYLLARELRHKAEELNQLFVQAQRQKLKVEVSTSRLDTPTGESVTWLELRIFKEL